MASFVTMALTIFYVIWLVAVLLFLWIIWRTGVRQTQKLESTMTEAALMTAQAARHSSEAALALAQSYTQQQQHAEEERT